MTPGPAKRHRTVPVVRRLRALLIGGGLVILVAAVALASVAGLERLGTRIDLTARGEQRLAPQTQALLARADEQQTPVRIVVVGRVSDQSPRLAREVLDVLDLFSERPLVDVTVLDAASPQAAARYQSLLADLQQTFQPQIDVFTAELAAARLRTEELSGWLTSSLSPRLLDLGRTSPAFAAQATEAAAAARLFARELEGPLERLPSETLDRDITRIASADAARDQLAPLLDQLARQLALIGQRVAAQPGAAQLAAAIGAQRDAAATTARTLSDLQPPSITRAVTALERGEGVLVFAGDQIAAAGFNDLFAGNALPARTDVRTIAETCIAGLLAAVLDRQRPIIVLVHPEFAPLLDRFRGFDGVFDRQRARGIDVLEQPAGREGLPPADLASIDPTRSRPVVYVVLAPDSTLSRQGEDPATSGPARAQAMSSVVSGLLARGESVLISLSPSVLPALGSTDPMSNMLQTFGLSPNTAAPIVEQASGPQGSQVAIDLVAIAQDDTHPIAAAIKGLPTLLPWPVAVGSGGQDLLSLEGDSLWAESDWLNIWRMPHAQRGPLLARTDFDASRDDNDGPWVVAAAAERSAPSSGDQQRLVVVGSNGWFSDGLALATSTVDGREVLQYPGNIELFEASVLWLAGRDDEVAPSPGARSVPLIKPRTPSELAALRWSLVLGLPMLVLAIGGLVRFLRR